MLFHLHIPKTGGTTLFFALAAAVEPGRSHVAMSEAELRERTTGYELLGGHFDWDILSIFPEPPRVVTVLRDPVEVVLSAYGYWKAHAHEGVFGPEAQRGAEEALAHSVDELVLDPQSQLRTTFAMMTNYLAGKAAAMDKSSAEVAMRHLESCAWVGTTDTLDRDIKVIPEMLGLAAMPDWSTRMATPDRPRRHEIGPATLRMLEEVTQSDRKLYDRALEMADEQQRRFG